MDTTIQLVACVFVVGSAALFCVACAAERIIHHYMRKNT